MLDSQGFEFEGKLRWNIEKTFVGEKNIQRSQTKSIITHIYYEYVYGLKDYRRDHLHKSFIKRRYLAWFSVQQLYKYLDIAKIIYYVVEYKKKDVSIAYGPKDPDSTFRKSQFEARIWKQLDIWFKDQLDKGIF